MTYILINSFTISLLIILAEEKILALKVTKIKFYNRKLLRILFQHTLKIFFT
jgi:hypothetical protein